MATSVLILGPEDTLEQDDWVRPLQATPGHCGGDPVINSLSTDGETPQNHLKWVRARDVFKPGWFGLTLEELNKEMGNGFNYEVIRGAIPRGHIWFWRAQRDRA